MPNKRQSISQERRKQKKKKQMEDFCRCKAGNSLNTSKLIPRNMPKLAAKERNYGDKFHETQDLRQTLRAPWYRRVANFAKRNIGRAAVGMGSVSGRMQRWAELESERVEADRFIPRFGYERRGERSEAALKYVAKNLDSTKIKQLFREMARGTEYQRHTKAILANLEHLHRTGQLERVLANDHMKEAFAAAAGKYLLPRRAMTILTSRKKRVRNVLLSGLAKAAEEEHGVFVTEEGSAEKKFPPAGGGRREEAPAEGMERAPETAEPLAVKEPPVQVTEQEAEAVFSKHFQAAYGQMSREELRQRIGFLLESVNALSNEHGIHPTELVIAAEHKARGLAGNPQEMEIQKMLGDLPEQTRKLLAARLRQYSKAGKLEEPQDATDALAHLGHIISRANKSDRQILLEIMHQGLEGARQEGVA